MKKSGAAARLFRREFGDCAAENGVSLADDPGADTQGEVAVVVVVGSDPVKESRDGERPTQAQRALVRCCVGRGEGVGGSSTRMAAIRDQKCEGPTRPLPVFLALRGLAGLWTWLGRRKSRHVWPATTPISFERRLSAGWRGYQPQDVIVCLVWLYLYTEKRHEWVEASIGDLVTERWTRRVSVYCCIASLGWG